MNFPAHDLIVHLFPLHRDGQVATRQMNVFLAHRDAAVSHQSLDFKGTGAGLGKSCAEGVPQRVEHEFRGQSVLVSKCSMPVVDRLPLKVSAFSSGKQPFGIRPDGRKQGDRFSGSGGLRQSTARVLRFPRSHRNAFIGTVGLSQAQTLFGSQAEVEHQNCDFAQGVGGEREIQRLETTVHNEFPALRSGNIAHFRPALDQSPLVSEDQGAAQGRHIAVERRDHDRALAILLVVFNDFLVHIRQPQLTEWRVSNQAPNLLDVELHGSRFRGVVLPDVIQEPAFEEFFEQRRCFRRGNSERFESGITSHLRFNELGFIDVGLVGRTLVPFTAVDEVEVPEATTFCKGHQEADSNRNEAA